MRQEMQGMAELMRQQQQSLQQVQQLLLQHLQQSQAPPAAAEPAACAASAQEESASAGGAGGDAVMSHRRSHDATPPRIRRARDQATDLASKGRAAGDGASSAGDTSAELGTTSVVVQVRGPSPRVGAGGGCPSSSGSSGSSGVSITYEPGLGPVTSQGQPAASAAAAHAAGRLQAQPSSTGTGTSATAWAGAGLASKATAPSAAAGATTGPGRFGVSAPSVPPVLAPDATSYPAWGAADSLTSPGSANQAPLPLANPPGVGAMHTSGPSEAYGDGSRGSAPEGRSRGGRSSCEIGAVSDALSGGVGSQRQPSTPPDTR